MVIEFKSDAETEPELDTSQAIHLDTTVVIEQCKVASRALPVVAALKQFPFKSTSSYGRYEFKRTWVRDMVWLYEKLGVVKDPAEVLNQIGKAFQGYQRNRLSRMLEVVAAFVGKLGPTTPYDLFAIRIREYLANAIDSSHMIWQRSVTHEFNGTNCVRADEQPKRGSNEHYILTLPNCRRGKINCSVHSFFSSNSESFKRIAALADAMGSDASPQLKTAAAEIAASLLDPPRLCDNRVCAKLGDSLIAVDGRQLDVFGANNDAEWLPISKALDKKLFNPTKPSPVLPPP